LVRLRLRSGSLRACLCQTRPAVPSNYEQSRHHRGHSYLSHGHSLLMLLNHPACHPQKVVQGQANAAAMAVGLTGLVETIRQYASELQQKYRGCRSMPDGNRASYHCHKIQNWRRAPVRFPMVAAISVMASGMQQFTYPIESSCRWSIMEGDSSASWRTGSTGCNATRAHRGGTDR
jgi:hypothetical protein